jgi:hypothetical protein
VDECASSDSKFGIGTQPGLLQRRSYLTSFTVKLGHGDLLSISRPFSSISS